MSEALALSAEPRDTLGKANARRMRRLDDTIPAIVYGAGKDPQNLTLSHKDTMIALENEAVYASILTLNVAGKAEKVVLKALQRHPYKRRIMHADFLRVSAKEKITMNVPLHYTNEDSAPGTKAGGIASHLMTDIEIKCLPADLPEFLEIDASGVELDHSLHLSDIKLPNGVEMTTEVDEEHDQPIFSIHKPRAEKEVAPEEDAAEAGNDGDAPAGNAEKPAE